MSRDKSTEAQRIAHRRYWRRSLTIALLALAITFTANRLGIWTWPAHGSDVEITATVSGDGWATTDPAGETRKGYVWMTHPPKACWHWAAGWVALPGPCGWHRLPGWFRRGVGSTVTGCLIGLVSGGNVPLGCLGGALGSIDWGR